jgi:predicted dehydrogenase
MKAPIRIGILGAAKIAPTAIIAPARENDEFVVSAVGARDEGRATRYATEHGIAEVAADYADLVSRDDVDLVYVALPPSMHAEWSIRALESGKAVLCEKPFSLTAHDARTMTGTAARTGRALLEAFHYRHHDIFKHALAIARDGRLGDLLRAEATFEVPIPHSDQELRWLAPLGGGALMDLGCYCIHALRTIAGAEPAIDRAKATIERGVDVATEASVRFPQGLSAEIRCAMSQGTPAARLFVEGTRGTVEIQNFIAPQIGCRMTTVIDGRQDVVATSGPSTFAAQLAHVGDVLLRGAPPLTGGTDAVANMAAIDAIYAAAGVRRPPA